MSAPVHGATQPDGTCGPRNRLLSALLLLFCSGHAIYLLVSIAPKSAPEGDAKPTPAAELLRLCKVLVGGAQYWNMFQTIPVLHSMTVRIETEDSGGHIQSQGCMLPGLAPYPEPEDARCHNLYFRMLSQAKEGSYFHSYLRRLGETPQMRSVKAQGGRWWLAVDVEWTRTLAESRRDGILYLPASRTFDPANPGGVQR